MQSSSGSTAGESGAWNCVCFDSLRCGICECASCEKMSSLCTSPSSAIIGLDCGSFCLPFWETKNRQTAMYVQATEDVVYYCGHMMTFNGLYKKCQKSLNLSQKFSPRKHRKDSKRVSKVLRQHRCGPLIVSRSRPHTLVNMFWFTCLSVFEPQQWSHVRGTAVRKVSIIIQSS